MSTIYLRYYWYATPAQLTAAGGCLCTTCVGVWVPVGVGVGLFVDLGSMATCVAAYADENVYGCTPTTARAAMV